VQGLEPAEGRGVRLQEEDHYTPEMTRRARGQDQPIPGEARLDEGGELVSQTLGVMACALHGDSERWNSRACQAARDGTAERRAPSGKMAVRMGSWV
jgi:hypothetical protein